jgi:hypothetical protein
VVLVTVPTQVVDPSGNRAPLPDDPAAWLARHPDLFISQVRQVRVGGFRATQLDYRRSRTTAGTAWSDRLPLFCGWRAETEGIPGSAPQSPGACTRITADARVRATFIHVGDRTVLVEAVWRAPGGAGESGRIPRALQRSYTALLAGLTPAAASKTTSKAT